jgi:hypothetical protein
MIAQRIKDALANLHADAKTIEETMSLLQGGPMELDDEELAALAETQATLARCLALELEWRHQDDPDA